MLDIAFVEDQNPTENGESFAGAYHLPQVITEDLPG
jgi:hypothetical protein